jgi:hypothetical protein
MSSSTNSAATSSSAMSPEQENKTGSAKTNTGGDEDWVVVPSAVELPVQAQDTSNGKNKLIEAEVLGVCKDLLGDLWYACRNRRVCGP